MNHMEETTMWPNYEEIQISTILSYAAVVCSWYLYSEEGPCLLSCEMLGQVDTTKFV